MRRAGRIPNADAAPPDTSDPAAAGPAWCLGRPGCGWLKRADGADRASPAVIGESMELMPVRLLLWITGAAPQNMALWPGASSGQLIVDLLVFDDALYHSMIEDRLLAKGCQRAARA
jgi:hypothetical protein